jgi:hypothetical protein
MIDKDLLWRIEATFLYTWPALEQISMVDWVSRFSNGLSRRANSANPVCEPQRDFETTIAAVEALARGDQFRIWKIRAVASGVASQEAIASHGGVSPDKEIREWRALQSSAPLVCEE